MRFSFIDDSLAANDTLNHTIKTYKLVVVNGKKVDPQTNLIKSTENGAGDLLQSIIDAPNTGNASNNMAGSSFDDLHEIFSQATSASPKLTSNSSDLLQPITAKSFKIDEVMSSRDTYKELDDMLFTDILSRETEPATVSVETLLRNHHTNKPAFV